MGGTSSERDVSLASGLRIAGALRERGHDVRSMDTAKGPIDLAAEQQMLAGSVVGQAPPTPEELAQMNAESVADMAGRLPRRGEGDAAFLALHGGRGEDGDRKSTRLNSSHANISYAVFCFKKKKKRNEC